MKLLRYGSIKQEKTGIVDNEGNIRDLSNLIPDLTPQTIPQLSQLGKIDLDSLAKVEGNPRIGSCVSNPGKFICIGLNYSDHAAESNMEVPPEPVIFFKAPSAVCGPNDDIEIPKQATKTDWEVELGVVIGKEAKYISEENALKHVAGFCLVNDLSERHFQLERYGQWVKGKSHDTFAPIGPYLVTPDDVEDYNNLKLWLEVDGKRYQDGNTKTMIYKVPFIISYLSNFMSLQPGDVISTGTPPGVGLGQKPPIYLKAGQTIRLGIDGLGEQNQKTIAI